MQWIYDFGAYFKREILALSFVFGAMGFALAAPVGSFPQYIERFESVALQQGVSRAVYQNTMSGLTKDPSIARRISGQPEFTTPIWDYIGGRVSSSRINRGKSAFERNRDLFARVGQAYGVDPFILAAIWGIETDYGAVLSNRSLIKPIIPSLASLAYEQRGRAALDEAELIAALKLVQSGRSPQDLLGSWAGSMGHLQVNSSILLANGADGNGDGRVDVHNSLADALATSAVLINSFGYVGGVDWGFEVQLPSGFDYSLATRNEMKRVSFFAERGVARVSGRQFADLAQPVFLYLPAGKDGPKFLMTQNYLVLKSYNFSDSYALSVAHLTDRLKGAGAFVNPWPTHTRFPNLAQRISIQTRLKQLGFYQGEVDGRIGPITQEAYQQFQIQRGVPADGFITLEAFHLLNS